MIKEAISSLIARRSLSKDEAAQVMAEIMSGEVTAAQFGAFVTALRLKGETVEEIAGLAQTMRAKALPVTVDEPVVDTCGTGGDGAATFNISTTAAFVVAGAGLKVAKHGNRAMSSRCGSADVLEALGIKLEYTPAQVRRSLDEVGIGFMFAPAFHPAMKYAAGPRKEIGFRTVFNILGPLTNPAGAGGQVLGVADGALVEKMARVLQSLGTRHALVVHGEDGLDEITLAGETRVCEVKDGMLESYRLAPEHVGMACAKPDELKGGTAAENAATLRRVLSGDGGKKGDVVLLNAAAALLAGDKAESLADGVRLARESIASGRAMDKLEKFIAFSRSLG